MARNERDAQIVPNATSREARPFDLDTSAFSTRFDEGGLLIRSYPYRGGELVSSWLMITIACACFALYMLDRTAPSLHVFARLWPPLARPMPPWLGVPLIAIPSIVGAWFAARLIYRLFGRESVHMDTTSVTITKSLFGVSRTRRFDSEGIQSIRTWGWSRPYWSYGAGIATSNPPRGPFGQTDARRVIPSHPGGLFFIHEGMPVRFLTALRPGAAIEVLKIIVRIWPRLLAPSEGTRVSIHEEFDDAPVTPLNDRSPW